MADPSIPDVEWRDLVDLLPAAFGVMIVCAEAVGVSRTIAGTHGYCVDANRDLVALGGSNLLPGLSRGFVQSGGASQTMAAKRAGGRTQLGSLVAGVLVLLTGARADRHPGWSTVPQAMVASVDGPLFYANAVSVKERLLDLVGESEPRPEAVVLELAESPDLDVETLDMLGELADALTALGVELRLAMVRTPALELLRPSGIADRVRIEPTLDAAVRR